MTLWSVDSTVCKTKQKTFLYKNVKSKKFCYHVHILRHETYWSLLYAIEPDSMMLKGNSSETNRFKHKQRRV